MQVCSLPSATLHALDKNFRTLLWEGSRGVKHIHLVNWYNVTLPKSKGGLGIPTALNKNLALLTSLAWSCFISHLDSL